eukprot:5767087-Amphidinium_carterae.1
MIAHVDSACIGRKGCEDRSQQLALVLATRNCKVAINPDPPNHLKEAKAPRYNKILEEKLPSKLRVRHVSRCHCRVDES